MANVVYVGHGSDLAFPYHNNYGKYFRHVKIVPIESIANDPCYLANPEVGMVYIKHPYLPIYLPNNDELELNIYRQSIQEVFNLAEDLGAVRCDYTLSIEQRSIFGFHTKGKVSTPKGDGEMEVSEKLDKYFWQQLGMKYENERIDGSKIITQDEYLKAVKRLNESDYLKRDPIAKDLLERRTPEYLNQRRKMTVTYSLISDINEDLAAAAKLKAASGILKINGSYTQNRRITRKVSATYTIVFWEEEKNEKEA